MAKSKVEERVEAVIISGPRKGELITLGNGNGEQETRLTPAEEAALDFLVEVSNRVAQSATEANASARALRERLQEVLGRLHESVGADGGTGEISINNGRSVEANANGTRHHQPASAVAERQPT